MCLVGASSYRRLDAPCDSSEALENHFSHGINLLEVKQRRLSHWSGAQAEAPSPLLQREKANTTSSPAQTEQAEVFKNMRVAFDFMDRKRRGSINFDDFEAALGAPSVDPLMEALGILRGKLGAATKAEALFRHFDHDQTGLVDTDDFIAGCLKLLGQVVSRGATTDGETVPAAYVRVLRYGTAKSCVGRLEKIPEFTLADLLDDPPLLCFDGGNRGNAVVMEQEQEQKQKRRQRLKQKQKQEEEEEQESKQLLQDFTGMANPIFSDYETTFPKDILDREHIFVFGPETSGTRFVTHLISMARNFTDESFEDFRYDSKTAMFHISLPWGSTCKQVHIPVFKDFGLSNAQLPARDDVVRTIVLPKQGQRLMVDIQSLVDKSRARGDHFHVLQVVRDPRESLAGKEVAHCNDPVAAQAEQSKAFELMLAAKDLPDVKTICYETMVSGPDTGKDYINEFLTGLKISLPRLKEVMAGLDIHNGNKHVDHGTLPGACTYDMQAYMELCPETSTSEEFRQACIDATPIV